MTVNLTPALATLAAKTSLDLSLPMVDSIILCTARRHDAILWTQDEHFATIPGVRYFAKAPADGDLLPLTGLQINLFPFLPFLQKGMSTTTRRGRQFVTQLL